MANKQISQLTAKPSPVASTDQFGIDDNASDSWKITVANLQTYFTTLYLTLSGGTMTGNLILNGDPSAALQAATKQYVDAVATGLSIQPACRVATTGALTVSYNNGSSGVGATLTNAGAQAAIAIDGITLALNDRVLVKDQAAPAQNGIYTVTTLGSGASNWVMTRATDFDTAAEIVPGDLVFVRVGTLNQQTSWVQTATVATVGTDSITWEQFGGDITVIISSIQNNSYVYCEDTGAADAYVATPTPAITSYVEGLVIILDPDNANLTTTPTLNVSGLGVKTIVNNLGGALVAGDIVPGQRLYLLYDGTNFRLINRNMEKRIQDESFNYILDSGSVNLYAAVLVPAVTAYVAGLRVSLKVANTNTSSAPSLNVNALGVKTIVLADGTAIPVGSMVAGMVADLRYDGTNFQLLNPYQGVVAQPNVWIGGNFDTNPWQRGTSFAAAANNSYSADRLSWATAGAGVVTLAKTADAPTAAQAGIFTSNCWHADVTTADAAIAAGDYYSVIYYMEGYDFAQIAQKTFTVSFWVKSTITGTYCLSMFNAPALDRTYVAEYTVNVADTWEYKTIVVPASPSGGTWNYTNGTGLSFAFALATGSTFQGTAGSWQTTAGLILGSASQVNAMSDAANNFKLALIKVEPGSVATPYPVELDADVLGRCQRYYQKTFAQGTAPAQNTAVTINTLAYVVVVATAVPNGVIWQLPVEMRVAPTITFYNPEAANTAWRRLGGGDSGASSAGLIGTRIVYCVNPQVAGDGLSSTCAIHASANADF